MACKSKALLSRYVDVLTSTCKTPVYQRNHCPDGAVSGADKIGVLIASCQWWPVRVTHRVYHTTQGAYYNIGGFIAPVWAFLPETADRRHDDTGINLT